MKIGTFLRIGNFPEKFWQGEFSFVQKLKGKNLINHVEFGLEYPYLGPSTCTQKQIEKIKKNLEGLDIVIHPQLYYEEVLSSELKGKKFNLASLNEEVKKFSLEEMTRCYDIAAKLNAKVITIHGGYCENGPRKEHFNVLRNSLEELNKKSDKIKIGLENLPFIDYFENYSIPCYPKEIAGIISGLDNIGVTLDTGHANTLMSPTDFYRELIKRNIKVFDMHVHDNKGEDTHLALGKGNINFKSFIQYLEESNYRGYFNLELDIPWKNEKSPSQKERKESIKFLRENFHNLFEEDSYIKLKKNINELK